MFGPSARILSALIVMTGLAVAEPLPAEVKAMTGTFTCTGHSLNGEMKWVDMTAHLEIAVALDGSWLHETLTAVKGGEAGHAYERYTTFDPTAKKLRRMMMVAGGDWYLGEAATCPPGKGCKTDWTYTAHNAMGEFPFKDHVELGDKLMKAWGELAIDQGKTWTKAYDMVCKR